MSSGRLNTKRPRSSTAASRTLVELSMRRQWTPRCISNWKRNKGDQWGAVTQMELQLPIRWHPAMSGILAEQHLQLWCSAVDKSAQSQQLKQVLCQTTCESQEEVDRERPTRARILGSTATTSERHFIALVRTAMALSPSTLRIYIEAIGN